MESRRPRTAGVTKQPHSARRESSLSWDRTARSPRGVVRPIGKIKPLRGEDDTARPTPTERGRRQRGVPLSGRSRSLRWAVSRPLSSGRSRSLRRAVPLDSSGLTLAARNRLPSACCARCGVGLSWVEGPAGAALESAPDAEGQPPPKVSRRRRSAGGELEVGPSGSLIERPLLQFHRRQLRRKRPFRNLGPRIVDRGCLDVDVVLAVVTLGLERRTPGRCWLCWFTLLGFFHPRQHRHVRLVARTPRRTCKLAAARSSWLGVRSYDDATIAGHSISSNPASSKRENRGR